MKKLCNVVFFRALCHAKFLICEIADFTPSAHSKRDFPGHAFLKRWLFTEISNMLRTVD